jgi:lysophospholipase L1-like esterase
MTIRLLIIIVAFAFLSACGDSGSSSSGGSGNKENLIVVLGDSIGAVINASFAFPDIIASNTSIPVINTSTPGISAEAGVARAQGLIDEHNPRYIVALLGTNNALGSGGEAEGAINSMQTLAEICEENGVICIIGTLPPITLSSNLNGNVKKINAGYLAIDGVRIADNNAVLSSSDIGSDGIHPNNSGQQKIGDTFSAQIP